MKKYIFIFFLFSVAAILYLSFPINSKEHFVSIKENKFKLNGKDFYPVVVNYLATLRYDGKELWAGPATSYDADTLHNLLTKGSCLKGLRADLNLIKQMGFNAVRICGIGEEGADDNDRLSKISMMARYGRNQDTTVFLSSDEMYKKYFDALSGLFNEVNNAGLKSIFLVRTRPGVVTTEDHVKKTVTRFRNDTSIMAYDLYNEPLYFDHKERKKSEVNSIVKGWHKMFKMYAPNHLFTIGLEGIREVFEWDPNMLDMDFISLHPYEFEPGQVMNELYWYGNYITKPWIIGETAIPADNDSVTYEEQKQFANKTLKQAYNCGASGYSWWQYKDVDWHTYRANYMGVVTRTGEIKINKDNLQVQGTVKPVAEAFKKFIPFGKKDSCICLSNYYNYSEGKASRIIGHLIDEETEQPIKGGVVLGWDEHWVHSYHTVTKDDGSFEVLGVHPFYHWIATATMYEAVRDDFGPNSSKPGKDNIPTFDLGTLKVKKADL
ncbi:MAG: hypothetical protein EPN85_04270 [Bacteroidetes bacterium]|nr:MAG: hypothetical protein EPN85_04270 [Bacteroidota bacterium]